VATRTAHGEPRRAPRASGLASLVAEGAPLVAGSRHHQVRACSITKTDTVWIARCINKHAGRDRSINTRLRRGLKPRVFAFRSLRHGVENRFASRPSGFLYPSRVSARRWMIRTRDAGRDRSINTRLRRGLKPRVFAFRSLRHGVENRFASRPSGFLYPSRVSARRWMIRTRD